MTNGHGTSRTTPAASHANRTHVRVARVRRNTDAMYQGSLWLAVLAPVLWFATVFLLTRAARAWVRFAWLAAGVILLVPWPFVMIGAVGQ